DGDDYRWNRCATKTRNHQQPTWDFFRVFVISWLRRCAYDRPRTSEGLMRTRLVVLTATLLAMGIAVHSSEARVVRIVVEQKRVVADGKSFGDVGPYERIDGVVYIEVDPKDPLNAAIVNLDKAPRTAKGLVALSSPFFILKPVDITR